LLCLRKKEHIPVTFSNTPQDEWASRPAERDLLSKFVQSFADWIEANRKR
jgi:predicted alpha/beta hydrolase